MGLVALTAAGIGGATVIGALIGFCFKKIDEKWNDGILGFAAGIMLAAAILGLILPSMEQAGKSGIWMTVAGVLSLLNLTASQYLPTTLTAYLSVAQGPSCLPMSIFAHPLKSPVPSECICLSLFLYTAR